MLQIVMLETKKFKQNYKNDILHIEQRPLFIGHLFLVRVPLAIPKIYYCLFFLSSFNSFDNKITI